MRQCGLICSVPLYKVTQVQAKTLLAEPMPEADPVDSVMNTVVSIFREDDLGKTVLGSALVIQASKQYLVLRPIDWDPRLALVGDFVRT